MMGLSRASSQRVRKDEAGLSLGRRVIWMAKALAGAVSRPPNMSWSELTNTAWASGLATSSASAPAPLAALTWKVSDRGPARPENRRADSGKGSSCGLA
jgi:hypothetical protein